VDRHAVGWCSGARRKVVLRENNGVRAGCVKNPVGKKLPACGAKLHLKGGTRCSSKQAGSLLFDDLSGRACVVGLVLVGGGVEVCVGGVGVG
jgi:hypothetical protein